MARRRLAKRRVAKKARVWESIDNPTAIGNLPTPSGGDPSRPVIMRTGMGPTGTMRGRGVVPARTAMHARLLAAQQAGIAEALRVQRRCDEASSGWSGDYNPAHGGDPKCRPR